MLKNRFPPAVKEFWIGHYTCLWCGQNTADALHHLISPTSAGYIKGDHNKSILNSMPICNHKCHLYNAELKKETPRLLKLVLEEIVLKGYEFVGRDYQFYMVYSEMYKQKTPPK